MKRIALLFTLFLGITTIGWGQVSIMPGNTVSENFDAIGTTATATMPGGWKVDKNSTVRQLGTYSAATSATERQGGNALPDNASNGIYNFGAGAADSATDRAIGFISSGKETKSGNLYVQLKNDGSQPITSFTISYDVEKYRNGTNASGFSIKMYYSNNGTNWMQAGEDFITSFSTDANNNGFTPAPGVTSAVSNKTLTLPNQLAPGSSIYLAWNYSVSIGTTTSSAQALSVDNVVILANLSLDPIAPELTADITDNNVDNDIEITFTDDATWRAAITAVKVGESNLNPADYEISEGVIKLKPSVGNALLTLSGIKAITVSATEYSDATVSQIINPGAPTSLVVTTQPAAPATNGAVLATQPVISIKDQYNNTVNTQVTVIAAADEDSWTLGGATSKTTSNGTATFTDLTATSENAVSNAEIDFSYASLSVTSSPFTIPAPPLSVPIALEATNINPTGFTANWTSVSSSDSYRLDVYDSEYEISFFEGFDNIGASSSSYSTRTWLGNNDISWTAIDARTDQTINGKAICIKNGYLESSAISMQSPIRVEFMITTPYSGSGNLKLYISYDDTFSSQIFGGEYNYGEDSDNVMVQFNNIQSVDGPFKIKIVNTSGRIVIDDLSFDIMYPNYVPGYQNITVSGTSYDVTGLTSGEYYYRVRAARDSEISSNSNVMNVLLSQQIYSVAAGEWYMQETWSSNTVPTIYDDVIISEGFPVTVSGTSDCSSINVESDLIIEDYASLIVKNQAQGEVTVKRYIDDEDYHLVSLPVTNTITAGPTFNGFYVDEYSEPTGSWTRLVDENNMLPMKGYSVARTFDAPTDLVFNGPIKGGDAVFTDLSFTSGAPGYSEGWNLIGNPFTSGITLEEGTDFSGLNGNVYAWNVESGNYESSSLLDGSGTLYHGFIKFFEGFFVKTTQSTNHLTIPTSAKVHGLKGHTKSSKVNELKLTVAGNNYSDIMMFVINTESTFGFDQLFDAYKLYGDADAPQLYTIAGGEKTSVSHIPVIDGLSELPIHLEVGAENNYTLSATDIEGFLQGTGVILKDKLTGQTINLRENPSYTFTAKPGDNADRFSLLFSPLGTPEAMSLQANVYAIDKEIRVQLNESAKGEVKITSLAGQVLAAKSFQSSTQVTLKAPAQSGVYMVTVVTEKGTMTRKVFIK